MSLLGEARNCNLVRSLSEKLALQFVLCRRVDAFLFYLYYKKVGLHGRICVGRLAQLVRAPALQAGGRRFEPCTAHHPAIPQRGRSSVG